MSSKLMNKDMYATSRNTCLVMRSNIDVVTWAQAVSRISGWAGARESRLIAICNVHVVVTAADDPQYRQVIDCADMATPDGAPIAWYQRLRGHVGQERINGPDLMWRCLAEAEQKGQVVSFYGGAPDTLEKLRGRLTSAFPNLAVGCMISPPYRELSCEEESDYLEQISSADTSLLFVGLGCPKQERWMAANKSRLRVVMLGVGAAFDYHAGTLKRAPMWMQRHGLEWLFRLVKEPRRLWKRYFVTNSRFVLYAIRASLVRRSRVRAA